MSLPKLLDELHSLPANEKGDLFEEVVLWLLSTTPLLGSFRSVHKWDAWDGRPAWGPDTGIDLVAETLDGELCAVQAKCYSDEYSVRKRDLDSFLSASSRTVAGRGFSHRMVVATTDRLGSTARKTLDTQTVPVSWFGIEFLESLEVNWPSSTKELARLLRRGQAKLAAKKPRADQRQAIGAVLEGFKECEAGQLVMCCGTGKTLTTLWLSERMKSQRTLVLAPSLSLLDQTIREWRANSKERFADLAVCSDDQVGRRNDSALTHVSEIGAKVTTDPGEIAAFLSKPGRRVVFSTYQSSPAVADAQDLKPRKTRFDLVVADEAHRCAGPVDSAFATVLDRKRIRAERRLFTTATPRVFAPHVKARAEESGMEVASMDDESVFGAELYRMPFSEAIRKNLLCDYQVLVVGVLDSDVERMITERELLHLNGKTTDAESLARRVALMKAIHGRDLHRVLAFHSRVKAAEETAEVLPTIAEYIGGPPQETLWGQTVSGKMNAAERRHLLNRLAAVEPPECGVLTNARCLSEGIDVPAIDGVAFLDPRESMVDIVQAVGRVMRRSPGKEVGTIVVPVVIPSGADDEAVLDGSSFKTVWKVVSALRSHDDTISDLLDQCRRSLGERGALGEGLAAKIVFDVPGEVPDTFLTAIQTRLVRRTSDYFEEGYGRLLAFVEREGHSRVPGSHRDGGFNLGTWVATRRHRRFMLTEDQAARLEALPGWTWTPHESAWEKYFRLLTQFVEREGHARPKGHHIEDGLKLGSWVLRQRTNHSNGSLSLERMQRLENLPRWTWNTNEAAFEEGIEALRDFEATHGHVRVPTKYKTPDGFRLGLWTSNLRTIKSELSELQVAALDELPSWTWDLRQTKWEQAFQQLLEYTKVYGTTRVPARYVTPDGFRLGTWVNAQRQRKDTLSESRIESLESVSDWVWDPYEARWERGYSALGAFASREGHCLVPSTHEEGSFKLGGWVTRQRSSRTNLTAERRERLEQLPMWVWSARDAKWEEGFRHLLAYVERRGDAFVQTGYRSEDGYRLGQWVGVQRTSRHRLKMERKARLEALPGWVWDAMEAQWARAVKALANYADAKGTALVPADFVTDDGFRLGQWVVGMRARRSRLSGSQRQLLERFTGWTWDVNEARWEEGFAALQSFVQRNHHARVPQAHVENGFHLGTWVANQRTVRARMSKERIARLESQSGWTWDARASRWEEGFAALERFHEREGHCLVPQSHEEGEFPLGQWVARQRQRRVRLSSERTALLEAQAGWAWSALDAQWEKLFNALVRYSEREGHADVPAAHREDGLRLGGWVGRQRQARSSMTSERATRLTNVRGWRW
ncbi:MAG: Helicase associated domain protein [Actinomycetes bacterium]